MPYVFYQKSIRKVACESCVRGHRSSGCKDLDRIQYEVRTPGRPLSKCPHGSEGCPTSCVGYVAGPDPIIVIPARHTNCGCDVRLGTGHIPKKDPKKARKRSPRRPAGRKSSARSSRRSSKSNTPEPDEDPQEESAGAATASPAIIADEPIDAMMTEAFAALACHPTAGASNGSILHAFNFAAYPDATLSAGTMVTFADNGVPIDRNATGNVTDNLELAPGLQLLPEDTYNRIKGGFACGATPGACLCGDGCLCDGCLTHTGHHYQDLDSQLDQNLENHHDQILDSHHDQILDSHHDQNIGNHLDQDFDNQLNLNLDDHFNQDLCNPFNQNLDNNLDQDLFMNSMVGFTNSEIPQSLPEVTGYAFQCVPPQLDVFNFENDFGQMVDMNCMENDCIDPQHLHLQFPA